MRTIKLICYTVLSFIVVLFFSTVWNYNNIAAFSDIATFLSITIGFSITALSIISTSSFSKYLYSIENDQNNSKTLLHNLVDKFKTSITIFISTIGLILLFKFIPHPGKTLFYIKSHEISFNIILKSLIWYMTIISFLTFFNLFGKFSKFIIKSATKN